MGEVSGIESVAIRGGLIFGIAEAVARAGIPVGCGEIDAARGAAGAERPPEWAVPRPSVDTTQRDAAFRHRGRKAGRRFCGRDRHGAVN